MKVVVLGGAGLMGSGVVRDLVSEQSEGIDGVVVADSSQRALHELKQSLPDARISYFEVDVADPRALRALFQGADVCINSVPVFAGLHMDIFEAALESGCPYLDLGGMGVYTTKQKARHQQWERAGLPAVLGVGADPGMSNVLCKAVAEELDEIDSINLYWGARLTGGESPVVTLAYNLETILAEYSNPNHQFLDGELTVVPPQSGKETIKLPEPFGEMEFMYSQHSEPLTVPFARGIADKGIREMTWKLHLPDEHDLVWKAMIKAGFGDYDDPLHIDGVDIKPSTFLDKLIKRNIDRNRDRLPDQSDHQIHFAIARGRKGGLEKKVTCTVTTEPDAFFDGYHDASTSMNASLSAQLMMRQETVPGVWGPEEYFDVGRYMAELRKRHFKATMTVETAL